MAKKKSSKQNKKMWSGRFSQETNAKVEKFTSSIAIDSRLVFYDILGSIAHVKMLCKIGVLTKGEEGKLCKALNDIARDILGGKIRLSTDHEDVHMAIEAVLTSKIGSLGKKLHTGRSRNDQVNLDIRLYMKAEIFILIDLIEALQAKLVDFSDKNIDVIIPEMTHMQHAQPTLMAHHILAYVNMLERDCGRLSDCCKRLNVLPLGAGACTGTGIPIDQEFVADLLGFDAVSRNSADAVSDRDFILELLGALSIVAMHLSRFAEDIVLWSSSEFGFISIGDAFCTGSSMMPQKKNPDVAELIRGKTGRVYGDLLAVLTMMKGLPLTYNRDMQEDKEPLFNASDIVRNSLDILGEMIPSITVNKDVCKKRLNEGFLAATDVAEYLVMKGVPFRDAHHVVGKLVAYCVKKSLGLDKLTLQEYKKFSTKFGSDVKKIIDVKECVHAKKSIGGTRPELVKKEIVRWKNHFKVKINKKK